MACATNLGLPNRELGVGLGKSKERQTQTSHKVHAKTCYRFIKFAVGKIWKAG